jgi:UDP-3-O-[3-hydroxymyristoyl] glucosamine N-acyltransferase
VLGDRVILQPGVVIGSDGYGYQFHQGRHQKIPQVGIVEIGDDVEVGANTCIDRARFGKTLIGEGTKIDNLVQIGHNVQIGKHCIVIALTGIAGSAKLGNYVTCAAQVGIAGHFEVGDKAVLAARTAVTNNLLGSQTYLGNPAQPMKDELKNIAMQRRLPKIVEEIKELKRKIQELES